MKLLYLYADAGLGEFYMEGGKIEGGNIPVNVLAHDWPSLMMHDLCCSAGSRPSGPLMSVAIINYFITPPQ